MKPFDTLDISDHYLKTGITYYAADHPTQPDGINAAVKAIVAELQNLDIPDAPTSDLPLQKPALWSVSGVGAQGTRPATWEFTGYPLVFAATINLQSPGLLFRAETPTNENIFKFMIWDIGGGVRRLYCQIGGALLADNNVTYQGQYPQTVGVIITATTVQFFSGHVITSSPIGYSATLPTATTSVIHTIGDEGFAGKVLRLGVRSSGDDLGVNSALSLCALPDDLSTYSQPKMYYTYHNDETALIDRLYALENPGDPIGPRLPLVSGVWAEW